jgi:predicted RNA polymerase sigma factor
MCPALCEEALRLGRILAELVPKEPEVHGLVALMEIQASRAQARVGSSGEPILLLDQNRARWDQLLIRRGLMALERAEAINGGQGGALGPYALQAAIAACHARALTAAETDWERIAALYDALAQIAPSPVVELNRAVAVSMAFGPAEGKPELVGCADFRAGSQGLPPLAERARGPPCQARPLRRSPRGVERAASLTRNARERKLLLDRAAASHLWPAS